MLQAGRGPGSAGELRNISLSLLLLLGPQWAHSDFAGINLLDPRQSVEPRMGVLHLMDTTAAEILP